MPPVESETGMLWDKLELAEPLGMLVERPRPSMSDVEISSGLNSDEDDDGARVTFDEPTGYGATGMSASEDADGL